MKSKRNIVMERLSSVESRLEALEQKDYAFEINKIKNVLASMKEEHIISSVESLYEKGKNFKDFGKKINNMVHIFEDIIKELKDFERDYNKVLNKVSREEMKEEEAIVEITNKVTEVDEYIDRKTRELK